MKLSSLIVGVDSIYGAEYEWTGKAPGLRGKRCVVGGCEDDRSPKGSLGMCRIHYRRTTKHGSPHQETVEERFWSKVGLLDPLGCWEWQASYQTDGYGWFGGMSGETAAHRVAWVLANGEIPDLGGDTHHGTCVLHKCDNRRCVNPDHLFLGTQADNVLDMYAKGRANPPHPTQCKRGHEFTENNTYRYQRSSGEVERQCRTCRAEWGKRRNGRK